MREYFEYHKANFHKYNSVDLQCLNGTVFYVFIKTQNVDFRRFRLHGSHGNKTSIQSTKWKISWDKSNIKMDLKEVE